MQEMKDMKKDFKQEIGAARLWPNGITTASNYLLEKGVFHA
jgi:hypothetical protein